MKFINDILYMEFSEVVECGVDASTLIKGKQRSANIWRFIDDPLDKRKVLIDYEHMKAVYKKLVTDHFGNPYDRMARMPILKLVELDAKAHEHYRKHTYTLGNKVVGLGVDVVNKYTRAASWLNMVNRVSADRRIVKDGIGISIGMFDEHVQHLVALEKKRGEMEGYAGLDVLPGDFPSSQQRLKGKAERYKAEGYDMLIDPLFGNKIASKLGRPAEITMANAGDDGGLLTENGEKVPLKLPKSGGYGGGFDPEIYEKQMAVIRAIARKHNNFDAGQVREMSNLLFTANGWKCPSVGRIRDIINENKHLLTAGRQGKQVYMDKVAMQNKRKGPPYPMIYWTLDGWTAELMYQERVIDSKGHEKTAYKRLVIVVVLDAYNKYPVGYAIGERENTALIRQACRNALGHVYGLTGAMYFPMQLQSDRYQVKNLTPFYQAMTTMYTPAQAHNAKSKIIEPYFKYLNKRYAQYHEFWAGFNVDAKKGNQVNKEWIDDTKGNAPNLAGVIKQLNRMMDRERKAKEADFMVGWAKLPEGDKKVLGEADYLRVIGEQLGERTSRITGQGIIKQVDGVERTYDSFDPAFRANMHVDWTLWGDKNAMGKVLAISPDEKLKFVLEEKRVLPMDIYSTTQEDVDYRMRVKHFNADRMAEVTMLAGADADMARGVAVSTPWLLNDEDEIDLKLMLTYGGQQKEAIQDAKQLGNKTIRQFDNVQKKEQKRLASEAVSSAMNWMEQQDAFIRKGVNQD